MTILITENLSNNTTLSDGGQWLFPAGGTNLFSVTLQRLNPSTGLMESVDVSSASEINLYITDRSSDMENIVNVSCSAGYAGADWANGIVTGDFDNSATELITHRGFANIVAMVTISAEREFYYSADKAVKIVPVP